MTTFESLHQDRVLGSLGMFDDVKEGLVCVLGAVEPCRSFGIGRNPDLGQKVQVKVDSGRLTVCAE